MKVKKKQANWNIKKKKKDITIKYAHFHDTDDEIKDPKELDPNFNHIMVFDDVMLKDQTVIKEYFTSGRQNNVNAFYLVQSLHKIAKQCIRKNANMLILFKQRKNSNIFTKIQFQMMIWILKNLDNFAVMLGSNHMGLLYLISGLKMMGMEDIGIIILGFTLQNLFLQ